MDIRINGKNIGGTVKSIPSKSQAHRMLICAALADGEGEVYCPAVNEDILATARCLRALGADICYENGVFHISPIKDLCESIADCGESGSTLRFLLPVACALGKSLTFTGSGRLPERPMAELCAALRSGGAELSSDKLPIEVRGRLRAGKYALPSKVSSQYISGLMFALPLLKEESVIELDGEPESAPYIEMTAEALRLFGVNTVREGNSFLIGRGEGYKACKGLAVEGDWSNAAFWLCAGAIGAKAVTVTGLNPVSKQGDKAVAEILRQFGAKVKIVENEYSVTPSELKGIEIDAVNIPDLVPVLAVTAAAAKGDTRVYNAGRLRIKESDRIASTAALLGKLGIAVEETPDGMIIHGGSLKGGRVNSFGDHRIAMAAAVASCAAGGEIIIENAGAVNKSYPGFFEDYRALGGEAREVSE